MKYFGHHILGIIFSLILHSSIGLQLFAQEVDFYDGDKIHFSSNNLTVKQALQEISTADSVSLIYGSNEAIMKMDIQFEAKAYTPSKAFQVIQRQAPVEFIPNNQHIIVRERELKEKYKLRGRIIDAETREPLIFAQIQVENTNKAVVSDHEGEYVLEIEPGIINISCSYMGYSNQQYSIKLFENLDFDIEMNVTSHLIQAVNITSSIFEIDLFEKGRSIEKVDGKIVRNLNTNTINEALHGRVNGVWATKVSGAPGDHYKIRIRGMSSIFGGTDPLYVVDGMIVPVVNLNSLGVADINNNDIEKITILKNASSTALYGYQGANGVVLIDTRKGGGKNQLEFSVKKGVQYFSKRYDLLDSESFLQTLSLSDENIGTRFYKENPASGIYPLYPRSISEDGSRMTTDNYQDELFRWGNLHEFQLSGKGKFHTINYYLSGNYYAHKGIINNTEYKKYTFAGNFSKTIGKHLSTRFLYRGSHQDNKNNLDNYLGNDVILKGINFEPAYRTTPDSLLQKQDRLYFNGNSDAKVAPLDNHLTTPEQLFWQQEKTKLEQGHLLSIDAFYQTNYGFSIKGEISYATKKSDNNSFIPAQLLLNNTKYLSSTEKTLLFSQQYDCTYARKRKNHSFNSVFRFRQYLDKLSWNVDSSLNVAQQNILAEDNIYQRGSMALYGSQGSVQRSMHSYIFSFNYSFKNKYYISILGNFDNLTEGKNVNRSDLFKSLAVKWDLMEEHLLNLPTWLSTFSIYANYGEAGNYPLNGLSNDIYSLTSIYSVNDRPVRASSISNLANHQLKHEKLEEVNIGSSIGFLSNRIMLSGDFYIKYNSNLLLLKPTPTYYGGGWHYQNIGELKSNGVELLLKLNPITRHRSNWVTSFGLSTYKQVITTLPVNNQMIFTNENALIPDFLVKENEEPGAIFGYKFVGVWNEENLNKGYVNHMGLAYDIENNSNSEQILPEHKTIIGSSLPDFMVNWINTIDYRQFSFEMLWYAVSGVDKYNATKASTYITGVNHEVPNIIKHNNDYHTDEVFYQSSYFVEDASFLRLKTLSLIYTPKAKIASKIEMQYKLSFENLITVTRYSGFDPESTIYTNNNFSDNAIDRGAYPNPTGVYVSVKLTL